MAVHTSVKVDASDYHNRHLRKQGDKGKLVVYGLKGLYRTTAATVFNPDQGLKEDKALFRNKKTCLAYRKKPKVRHLKRGNSKRYSSFSDSQVCKF